MGRRPAYIAAFVSIAVVSAAAPGYAQALAQSPQLAPLPPPGFVPPYEITRTVRAAGFDPLAPPLREGTTYVLRATDFRGILMRVVVDARTGAIRDANRIVPGPGNYGAGVDDQVGMMAPFEARPDDRPSAYGPPPAFDVPPPTPGLSHAMAPAVAPSPSAPRAARSNGKNVPLPRPRPATLALGKTSDDAKPVIAPVPKPPAPPEDVTATPPAPVAAAPPVPARPNPTPAPLTIDN